MPIHVIQNGKEIAVLRKAVAAAAANGTKVIAELVRSAAPIKVLAAMKFHEVGYHPIENRRLNFIEQVNKCRVPDDCIDRKRYPLFMARAVMGELIASLQLESLPSTGSTQP